MKQYCLVVQFEGWRKPEYVALVTADSEEVWNKHYQECRAHYLNYDEGSGLCYVVASWLEECDGLTVQMLKKRNTAPTDAEMIWFQHG